MKRYIKSFTTDELKSALGDNYPKSGYLYIFKHGIGPGTIPDDVIKKVDEVIFSVEFGLFKVEFVIIYVDIKSI